MLETRNKYHDITFINANEEYIEYPARDGLVLFACFFIFFK